MDEPESKDSAESLDQVERAERLRTLKREQQRVYYARHRELWREYNRRKMSEYRKNKKENQLPES